MAWIDDIKLGPPDDNGDLWHFGARPAEAVDAAKVEILGEVNQGAEAA
jgi:hypothetical protein